MSGVSMYESNCLLGIERTGLIIPSCALALSISPMLHGQTTGSLCGTVFDKSGSSISGATVTTTSQGAGVMRLASTDDVGHYLIPLLPIGMYTIHVEFVGFQSVNSKDVRLQVDETRQLDLTLAPASVAP